MEPEGANRIVLVANGELTAPAYARRLLRPSDLVIAVNGGTRLAWRLGRVPDLLVGDADSLPAPLQAWLEAHEVPRHLHPRDKEHTDLELALHHAATLGPQRILLLGITGGRVDHTVANLSLMALGPRLGVALEAIVGEEHLVLVQERHRILGAVGQSVSLLPWGGDAVGVSTEGLRWALHGETLPFGPARGISNEMAAAVATVTLRAGLLLVSHHRGPPL